MDPKYKEWIDQYVAERKVIAGMCGSATLAMMKSFPELKQVAGYVCFPDGGRAEHFWCVTPDGKVIDPTASQYQLQAFPDELTYEPWQPGDEVQIGRCMDCGERIYGRPEALGGIREQFCDKDCYKSFSLSLNK